MDNNNQISLNLRYSKINVLRYSQYDINSFDFTKEALIEYQSSFQIKIIQETSEIAILSTVKLVITETKELFAELKVENFFELKPFDIAVKLKDNKTEFEIPNDLLTHLTSLVVGTIRGILHEKLKGTLLQKEVFPLINTKELVNLPTTDK